jgi:hypothetical protein
MVVLSNRRRYCGLDRLPSRFCLVKFTSKTNRVMNTSGVPRGAWSDIIHQWAVSKICTTMVVPFDTCIRIILQAAAFLRPTGFLRGSFFSPRFLRWRTCTIVYSCVQLCLLFISRRACAHVAEPTWRSHNITHESHAGLPVSAHPARAPGAQPARRRRAQPAQGWPRIWVNSKARIGIFSQTAGSARGFWANPVDFTLCVPCPPCPPRPRLPMAFEAPGSTAERRRPPPPRSPTWDRRAPGGAYEGPVAFSLQK